MADVTRVVSRTSVPSGKRVASGRFARIAAQVLDLAAGEALEFACVDRKEGAHVRREVGRILKAEGKVLAWERSTDGTHYYFWIEVAS